VFTPDRLAVVKSGPAARRAYFDRVLARLLPARADLPAAYAAALGQRNAALRRVGLGLSDTTALDPWTDGVVALAADLVEARRLTIELLSPAFGERADELGLPSASVGYAAEAPTREDLDERLGRDLERGTTSAGPHLDEFHVLSGDRDLRSFGSQGEQRLAVLSLLLAEAELLTERGEVPPLLLLDDALSELDADRRRILSARLGAAGQTLVTATGAEALPLAPAQLLVVSPGEVRPG
jgi:DNA replication and repair protein RecF